MTDSLHNQLAAVRKALFGSSRPKRERPATVTATNRSVKLVAAPQITNQRFAGISVAMPF